MAQICLGLSGGLGPMIRPQFHDFFADYLDLVMVRSS